MNFKTILMKVLLLALFLPVCVMAADQKTITLFFKDIDVAACSKIGITPAMVENTQIKVDITPILKDPYNTVPVLLSGMDFDSIPRFFAMGIADYFAYMTVHANVTINSQQYRL